MKKKFLWLGVSCLMVLSLVLASCAPAVVEKKKEEAPPRPPAAGMREEAPAAEAPKAEAPVVEVPKYGGTLRFIYREEPQGFDSTFYSTARAWAIHLTNDQLIGADWAKGPAGTGEYPLGKVLMINYEYPAGELATSWEVPDPNTVIWHIRQGVYWQDKPPMNGRMLTAKDVARWITHTFTTTGSYQLGSFPGWFVSAEVDPDDDWSVIVKCIDSAKYRTAEVYWWLGQYTYVLPMDAIALYGNLQDWRNYVGTGPFMLTDWVPETSASYIRNPNYWEKDPVGPGKGNQLPYLDALKGIMIVDKSTALAALRTAQVDLNKEPAPGSHTYTWEDTKSLIKTNPKLLWKPGFHENAVAIGLRVDQPQLPVYKKDVRRALMMAVDLFEITETYFDGAAEPRSMPITPLYPSTWIPLEQLPESARELYTYNPKKARDLLAKAGYPNGFEIDLLTPNYAYEIDLLSLVKEYWADIGVTLNLDVREYAVVKSLEYAYTYNDGLMMERAGANPDRMGYYSPGRAYNVARIDDPVGNELRGEIFKWELIGKPQETFAKCKEAALYYIETASWLVLPAAYNYNFWWPWVKNYHGEDMTSYGRYSGSYRYIWIDQDLKKSMGYK